MGAQERGIREIPLKRRSELITDIRSAMLSMLAAPLTLPLSLPVWLTTLLADGILAILRLKRTRHKVVGSLIRLLETGPWGSSYDSLTWAPWRRLCTPPLCTLALLDGSSQVVAVDALPAVKPGFVRIVAVSDTHGKHDLLRLPRGDILVHSGDILSRNNSIFGNSGRADALAIHGLRRFNAWLGRMAYAHCVVIGGNHDSALAKLGMDAAASLLSNATYLENSTATVGGVKFYGSPWSHTGKSSNKAWQATEPERPRVEANGIQVVVMHQYHSGLVDILKPELVVSGHCHESHGVRLIGGSPGCGAAAPLAVNAATCNAVYRPWHNPIVIDVRCQRHAHNSST